MVSVSQASDSCSSPEAASCELSSPLSVEVHTYKMEHSCNSRKSFSLSLRGKSAGKGPTIYDIQNAINEFLDMSVTNSSRKLEELSAEYSNGANDVPNLFVAEGCSTFIFLVIRRQDIAKVSSRKDVASPAELNPKFLSSIFAHNARKVREGVRFVDFKSYLFQLLNLSLNSNWKPTLSSAGTVFHNLNEQETKTSWGLIGLGLNATGTMVTYEPWDYFPQEVMSKRTKIGNSFGCGVLPCRLRAEWLTCTSAPEPRHISHIRIWVEDVFGAPVRGKESWVRIFLARPISSSLRGTTVKRMSEDQKYCVFDDLRATGHGEHMLLVVRSECEKTTDENSKARSKDVAPSYNETLIGWDTELVNLNKSIRDVYVGSEEHMTAHLPPFQILP